MAATILPFPGLAGHFFLPFAGSGLDRAARLRPEHARLAALAGAPHSRFLPLRAGDNAFCGTPEAPRLLTLSPSAAAALHQRHGGAAPFPDPVFLGLLPGEEPEQERGRESCPDSLPPATPLFAFALPEPPDSPLSQPEPPQAGIFFADLRRLAGLLAPVEAACAAHARALLHWHRRHGFCPGCGHPTRSQDGGHVRRCTHPPCAAVHFPRTDPAVIMRVEACTPRGAMVLLARQPGFPAGMYSVLAGFVEPGECLEEAVQREVWEETAVVCHTVRYIASQPWPFPASLMIGFSAQASEATPPVPAAGEIEDARWCDRPTLALALAGHLPDFWLPGPVSLAHALLSRWLDAPARD